MAFARKYRDLTLAEQVAYRRAEERRFTDFETLDVGLSVVRASDDANLGTVVSATAASVVTTTGTYRRDQVRVRLDDAAADLALQTRALGALGATLVRATSRQCLLDRGPAGLYGWGINVDLPRGMLLAFAARAAP